jgi:hypothetical protein
MQTCEKTTAAPLTVVGKLPQGYIILCQHNGADYAFLVRSLGISVECPHCGATRCGVDMAQEYHAGPSGTGDRGVVIPLPQRTSLTRQAQPSAPAETPAARRRGDP